MAPTPELVESFDDASPGELVESMISRPDFGPTIPDLEEGSDFAGPSEWWMSTMHDDRAGFHERMVWFWHGHLTSSIDKASAPMMILQHRLLREHALGDFRTLLRQITLDPAMLRWLDGDGSEAQAPNENFSRELMELFTLGRHSGAYTEDDVVAGARALAGYWIDGDRLVFEAPRALRRDVTYLGTRVRDVDDVIDTVCDHPACAPHLVGRLYDHFVGGDLAPSRLGELSQVLVENDLQIEPVVREILLDPSFVDGPPPRPRAAIEWALAFERLIGDRLDVWTVQALGQMPMQPPNVAGWPGTDRWLSSGMLLTKGEIALDHSWDVETLDETDPVSDVLRRAVLYEVSDDTLTTLDEVARSVDGRRERATLLHAAVAMCPEFSTI